MIKIFIDTDVLIDFSKDKTNIVQVLFEKQYNKEIELYTNPAVFVEYFVDDKLQAERKNLEAQDFFKNFTYLTIEKPIALKAAELIRKDNSLFLGDALIAATCLIHDLQLLTRNMKHFKKIKGLRFYDYDSNPLMKYYGAFSSKKKLDMENLRDYIDYSNL